jgi:hypothetical protein
MAINLLHIEQYIIQRIKEVAPEINTASGSGVRDLLISPMIAVLQPLANEIHRIKKSQSLLNAGDLSEEDVDAILANIFIDRKIGSKAIGTATILLSSADLVTIPAGSLLYARGGLKFFTTQTVTRGPSTLGLDLVTGRYKFDLEVQAAEQGSEYNINAGEISGIAFTTSTIVGALNENAFAGGSERESSDDLLTRARTSIGARDLSTKRGALAIIQENFAEVIDVNVVGFGHEEMLRDRIYAPNLIIDGIEYGISAGVNLGGKIDIYIRVGTTVLLASKDTPSAGVFGLNRYAFYTGDEDLNLRYEEAGSECELTITPVVAAANVTLKQAWTDYFAPASVSIEEGRNIVFTSSSPGKNNSMEELKELRFVKGTGVIESVILNDQYIDIPGYYFPLNNYSSDSYLGTPDLRGGQSLVFEGTSPEELDGLDLFSGPSVDGGGSLIFRPANGLVSVDDNSASGSHDVRVLHLSTGVDTPLTLALADSEFTFAGWVNVKAAAPRNTIFNSFNVTHNFDLYIDASGYIHYNTISEGFGAQDNVTSNPVMEAYVDAENGTSNWVFLAFTYSASAANKAIYYADIHSDDLNTAPLATNSTNIGNLKSVDDFTLGTTKDFDNNVNRTFNGLMDSVQLYSHPLNISQLETVRKNKNSLTIEGLEDTTIPGELAQLITTSGENFKMDGGRIVMVSGASSGSYFDIISSSHIMDESSAIQELSITVTGTSGTPVTRIAPGDTYAVTAAPFLNDTGARTSMTDISGAVMTDLALTPDGEAKIGVGIDISYEAGKDLAGVATFVSLTDTRPANADILAKHALPVQISGSVDIDESVDFSEEEVRSAFASYVKNLPTGVAFNVIDSLNFIADLGIVGIYLPLDKLVFESRDSYFNRVTQTGVDDTVAAKANQYFVVSPSLSVNFV